MNMGGWSHVIGIAFKVDRLTLSFLIFTNIIWWVTILYSWNKITEDYKYTFFLLFLQGAFLGFVQTNDLFSVFIFIELITILSTILIVYKKDGYSVRAGFYYLLFNSVGMLFYLIGLCIIYNVAGSLNMESIKGLAQPYQETFALKLAYVFIVSGLGVKSAFFPVFNWLPKAHGAAPASISALLSGLLVKSGLYMFIRVNEILSFEEFRIVFLCLGFATALAGVIFALSQKDIKQILAFHTISQVGIILIGISAGTGDLYYGGLLHLFNHGFFKALLFLGAGFIINELNVRRVTEIRGIFKTYPSIALLMMVGMFSITGLPFFSGYVSKSIIKYNLIDSTGLSILLNIINLGTIISFIKVSQIFYGEKNHGKNEVLYVNIAMGILAIFCIAIGIAPTFIMERVWDISLNVGHFYVLKKWVEYGIYLVLGWFIYKQIIEKDHKILKNIRHLSISFSTAIVLLICFVFGLVSYTLYIY
jgi:multicomponent Na+:H+ antiporter subunit D